MATSWSDATEADGGSDAPQPARRRVDRGRHRVAVVGPRRRASSTSRVGPTPHRGRAAGPERRVGLPHGHTARTPECARRQGVLHRGRSGSVRQPALEASNVDLNRSTTATDRRVNGTIETIDLRSAYNNFWYDRGDSVVGTRRTSLVVDPPDGRIPDVTPQARERAAARAARSERLSEGPEDRSLAERCIMGFNSGPPIAPAAYNQNVQIFQTPNTVVLLNEMVHNARLVPLDGRPHGTIRQWAGDSRGRWPLHRDVVVGRRQPGTDAERIGADRALARGAVRNARLARRSQPSRDGLRRSLAQRYRSPPMRLADPPRNSRWPSDSVKFRPTALGVPSLAW